MKFFIGLIYVALGVFWLSYVLFKIDTIKDDPITLAKMFSLGFLDIFIGIAVAANLFCDE